MGERGHRVGGESMLLSVCTMTVQLLNPRSPHGLAHGPLFLDGLSMQRIALRDLGIGHRSERPADRILIELVEIRLVEELGGVVPRGFVEELLEHLILAHALEHIGVEGHVELIAIGLDGCDHGLLRPFALRHLAVLVSLGGAS